MLLDTFIKLTGLKATHKNNINLHINCNLYANFKTVELKGTF